MLHRYEWHTVRTETGIWCIEVYTASALTYTVYKMCTREVEVLIIWGGMCAMVTRAGSGIQEIQRDKDD